MWRSEFPVGHHTETVALSGKWPSQRKATTICLTNAMKSPITTRSTFVFTPPERDQILPGALASRVTQLAVIDALFVALALQHKTGPPHACSKTQRNCSNVGECKL